MAQKPVADNLPQVISEVQQSALDLLATPAPKANPQMCLFEELADWNEHYQRKHPKNKAGLTVNQEVFARLVAAGLTKTESYLQAYPNCKTENLATVYPKASRLAKEDKVRARIEAVKKDIAERALMPTTEYFSHLNDEIRKGGKEKGVALKLVAQIKGLLQAEKGQPGSAEAPFVICYEQREVVQNAPKPKN